jgi:hypothetical protein
MTRFGNAGQYWQSGVAGIMTSGVVIRERETRVMLAMMIGTVIALASVQAADTWCAEVRALVVVRAEVRGRHVGRSLGDVRR